MECVIPYSLEAEVSLLGSLFLNSSVFAKAKAQLSPTDFYLDKHQEIFRAVLAVGVDFVVITEFLKKRGSLGRIGGVESISGLIKSPITSAGFQKHIDIIKDCSIRRTIIRECSQIVETAHNQDIVSLVSILKGIARDVQSQGTPEVVSSQKLLGDVFDDIERRSKAGDHDIGIKTGLKGIDEHIGGLEGKSLTYIIGRPSMGKTALALAIAENIAQGDNGLVMFFSLEMGDRQLTRRRLASRSDIFLSRIRHGNIDDSQWDNLIKAANELSTSQMFIIDKPKFKYIESLIGLVESITLDQKLACVFVDHIQLTRSRQKFNSRHLEISHISNSLKDLAKELDIPVIGLCQLNREVEKRTNKRPQLFDLKESGDLEQDADIVIGIYRKDREEEEMELCGLKGRDIGTWVSTVTFDRYTQRIT
ncbi:MAG: DnaB-like helicase C-terminal domain-containing protein [Planctomycetota bacterium]